MATWRDPRRASAASKHRMRMVLRPPGTPCGHYGMGISAPKAREQLLTRSYGARDNAEAVSRPSVVVQAASMARRVRSSESGIRCP